jgi:N-acyl-D-aspartate/D-glutamate deacylase
MAWDVLVKNGTLIDGSGGEPVRADVAVEGERIAAVGRLDGRAGRVIDAEGALVTPGFVDIHTHLDAQICWDPLATSPCWHGVTSVVMGNCGVTFAPCKPEDREFLARLMESVEDIPAKSIMSGLRWDWESYGEYLSALEKLPKGVNVGGMVGHCAVRWWTMGKRSLDQKVAGEDDVARMREVVREAIRGGALGFSTSRTMLHKTPDGEPVPGTFAAPAELVGIGDVLGEEGRGVFEAVPFLDSDDADVIVAEIDWMDQVSRRNGRPLTFGMLQTRQFPGLWKTVLERVEQANQRGAHIQPQTQVRSVGVLFGLVNLTPFDLAGGTWGLLKLIPLAERLAAFRDPEKRAKLIEDSKKSPMAGGKMLRSFFLLRERDGATRYDLADEDSLAAIAERRGVTPAEAFMDIALETDGKALFIFPFANHDFEVVGRMLSHPQMVLGLADSGAHCGQIMDASLPTYFLSYWVREKGLFSLPRAIEKLTSEPARLFGLGGRGVVAPGAYADLNVIDFDELRVLAPEYVQDFPAGASRYVQRGTGVRHTLVNGRPFMERGRHTGDLAGKLLRSTD